MKLLRIVSTLAVALVTAATPFFQDDTAVAGVDVPARGSILGRDGSSKQCGPSGVCYAFMKRCNFLDCKNFTIECDNWCNDRLCTIGPDVCRKGGECASEYHCDGNVAPEGPTKPSTSARDVEPATGIEPQDTEELTQGVPPTDQETSPETKCTECFQWLKFCQALECRGPSTSTCRQHCQARLCTEGPATCRKGGACGRKNGCGLGLHGPPVPPSPDATAQVDNLALPARSEPEPDQAAGCPQCDQWLKECRLIECTKPSSSACRERCQARLCAVGPTTCRAGPCGRSTGCGGGQERPPVLSPPDATAQVDNLALPARSEPEPDQAAGCPSCNDWMKQCKRTSCARPWAPECQWDCQRRLCKDGPNECRKGGSCSQCDKAVTKRVDPVENDQTASCPSCVDWIRQCRKAHCARPWDPNCQWDCQRRLCKNGPNECRKGGSCSQCR